MENDDFYRRLRQKRVIVVTHVYGTGASQDLRRFFILHHTQHILFIGHPLFYDTHIRGSGYELYDHGVKVYERYGRNKRAPLFLGYFLHAIKSFKWILKTGTVWDLYVGSNNINACVGLLLRKIGKVKKVVYYVFDFNPHRYSGSVINSFYQWLDQFCVRYADETWNMSPRMATGRKQYFGFAGGKQKVIPVGLWLSDSASVPLSKIAPHTLAFVGHVQEKQGVQYVVRALPRIIRQIPDFRFMVIGGGEFIPSLQTLAGRLHVEKHITFTGFMQDHRDIDTLLATCAVGVALYGRYAGKYLSFSYFGNPTKIKTYFTAGLPVILSDVPYNAKEIEASGTGKIISYDPKNIADTVVSMLSDRNILEKYRSRVRAYRRVFDWNVIFSNAMKELV